MSREEIEKRIYPVGFYRQKAKQIGEIADMLCRGKALEGDRNELMAFPGVGRKTANLVLALAFGIPAITVDIHVFRISRRLGWCRGSSPLEVEEELMGCFDRDSEWTRLNQALVAFGQTICTPLRPKCARCRLRDRCPSAGDQTPDKASISDKTQRASST
jgi:endonuclease-3